MRHRRRPPSPIALIVAALLTACAGDGGPRYDDLLTDGRLRPDGDGTAPAEVSCADQTYFAYLLDDDRPLRAAAAIARGDRLVLGGCVDPGAGSGGGTVTLEVETDGRGPVVAARVALPAAADAWQQVVDLDRFAGRRATLAVRATRAAPQTTIYLGEAYLRGRAPAAERTAAPPQVLLISVDTLRHDAIAALGGAWPTPHLDRLVAEAQVFTDSYAAASWTKPSHGSLLTGQTPVVHRAFGYETSLHPAVSTLAERFQHAGFRTAGVVHDVVHLDPRFGFDRGFDDYRAVHWTLAQKARHAFGWIGRQQAQPFFYFLHTFEVHSDFHHLPYEAPSVRQADVDERFGTDGYGCDGGPCASGRLAEIKAGRLAPIAGEAEILRYLYGESVRHLDTELGRLFDDLRAGGLYDHLLIVLTSDHGELFLEHGGVLHGQHWQEVLRVPLIIKWPRGRDAGRRSALPVSALDVAPTVLTAAGVGAEGLPGDDLAQLRRADRPIVAGTFSKSVIVDGLKLILGRDHAPPLLFDLRADPTEQRNLAAERPGDRRRLRQLLQQRGIRDRALLKELDTLHRRIDDGSLSDEERARLRALGYLDG